MPVMALPKPLCRSLFTEGYKNIGKTIPITVKKKRGKVVKIDMKKTHDDIDMIFHDILPGCGMAKRKEQIELSHSMLNALAAGNIALSDAGTGIGKTYAYLVAGMVFLKHHGKVQAQKQPIVISTATIALQRAIQDEYIPFLSRALLQAGYVDIPILSIVRKGKSRYVCDKRLRERIQNVDLKKKNSKSAQALLKLQYQLDMDRVDYLSRYDRKQVSVPPTCDCKENCRYNRYLASCFSSKYQFHICNHNLLLADAIHMRGSRHYILPDYCALVIDEAHKLPGTARQMFGRTLAYDDILALALSLKREEYPLAAHKVIASMQPIARSMVAEAGEDACRAKHLKNALLTLENIRHIIGNELSRRTRMDLNQMLCTLELLTDDESDIVVYQDEDEYGHAVLCGAAGDTAEQMEKTLWSIGVPMLLTSGTLAVGTDFSRFKEQAGLNKQARLLETVSHSPFDYYRNCLLYVPYSAPVEREEDGCYYKELARDISELVKCSNGHALVLFNSYSTMSAVRELLDDYHVRQPMFVMSRNNPHILNAFKKSGNGILLATGAAWEGMDFPGDLVSMLTVPRLPFPIPDAFSDRQKEQYPTIREFIKAVALPDMQIKLRQGFGRAIRLETDTCVIAILDERALRGRRYHEPAKKALPNMPMTGSLRSVERFLRSVKDNPYFEEINHAEYTE